MKWELVSNQKAAIQEFHLLDDNQSKLVLKYNPLHQSARVSSNGYQRLFFIESAGSLSGKSVFKNEYGMEIGHLLFDKWHSQDGAVVIDDQQYRYQLHTTPTAELAIYDEDPAHPLTTCNVQPGSESQGISFINNSKAVNNSCLLLALCWYQSLTVTPERLLKIAV